MANKVTTVETPVVEDVVLDGAVMKPNIVTPRTCPFDGTPLLYDADGSITGLGEACWYCPLGDY